MPTVLLSWTQPAVQLGPALNLRNTNQARPRVRIPAVTNLSAFRGEALLLLLDADNWDISAKAHGLNVRYDRLLKRLYDQTSTLDPVAVITSNPDDHRREDALANSGFRVVSIPREVVAEGGEIRKVANADADLSYELGARAGLADYSAICLGTGDGDLAISCSRGWKRTHGRCTATIHALSIAGATSARLRRREWFDSSTLLGMDLLVPLSADRQPASFPLGGSNGRNASVVA